MKALAVATRLQARAQQVDALVAALRDGFVLDSATTLPDLLGLMSELRWQTEQLQEHLGGLDGLIGVRRRSLPAATPRRPLDGLRGTTRTLPTPELINLLSNQHMTGSLWLKTDQHRYVLEFLDGAVIHAATDRPRPNRRLGTILVSQRKLSTDRLEEFLASFAPRDGRIGTALVRMHLITADDLRAALEEQVRELFVEVFALDDAQFYFADGKLADIEQRVSINTTQLLLEAARWVDELNDGTDPAATATAAGGSSTAPVMGSPDSPAAGPAGEVARATDAVGAGTVPGVSARSVSALRRGGFATLDDLRGASDAELLALRGVGRKTVDRIRAYLNQSASRPAAR